MGGGLNALLGISADDNIFFSCLLEKRVCHFMQSVFIDNLQEMSNPTSWELGWG